MTDRRPTVRVVDDRASHRPDTLVVEEPLEIRVGGSALAVTMRTPGDDVDLAVGFLCTEGVVRCRDDVRTARHCAGNVVGEANAGNVLDVALAAGTPAPSVDPTRNFYTTSSCGLCGKASIDAVRTRSVYPVADDPLRVSVQVVAALPDRLRAAQRIFDRTGGLHAAGLFAPDGTLLCVREDVGRHNAVDKVIGWALRNDRLPLAGVVLLVSGRASFELVQKASMAGIPMLAAVSAPSTLAVDLAAEVGMTLVGFLRGNRMNVYTGPDRVTADHDPSPGSSAAPEDPAAVGRHAAGGSPPASAWESSSAIE
nr:formate dehydrogenase accessory sulfurtransferase FdhD [Actinocatenispora thailandica]